VRTLAVYSIKGGVGKTTSSVNLAWFAAREGLRVLIWDLDPQGAATFYLRVEARVKGGGKKLVRGRTEVDPLIRASDYDGLDLLPADFSYRKMDIALHATEKPEKQLRRVLRPIAEQYDLLVLDCPPGISLSSESVFRAADLLVVPTIPTTLSVRSLVQLERHLARKGPKKLRLSPFFSMVDRRKVMHRDISDGESPGFLPTRIPFSSVVERMGRMRQPLPAFSPSSRAAKAFGLLWGDVRRRLF